MTMRVRTSMKTLILAPRKAQRPVTNRVFILTAVLKKTQTRSEENENENARVAQAVPTVARKKRSQMFVTILVIYSIDWQTHMLSYHKSSTHPKHTLCEEVTGVRKTHAASSQPKRKSEPKLLNSSEDEQVQNAKGWVMDAISIVHNN